MKNKHLVIIAGPTAVGKTALAVDLAKHFNTEILSADSRQFFREMTIGTAKPSAEELAAVPHHFINSLSIAQDYNPAMYEADVLALLQELFTRHEILILAGGSGLYIDAVCKGFDELPDIAPETRKKINEAFEAGGIKALQDLLKVIDPEYLEHADVQNPQRLTRAIEVSITAGVPYSSLRKGKAKERDFNIIRIAIEMDRNELYKRIDQRVDEMFEAGLVEEAKDLLPYRGRNALETVGYKELFDYFDGKISLDAAKALIKQHTRNYAKRQLTWFRRDPEFRWFRNDQLPEIISLINKETGKH